jgi:hypothetical protein
MGDDPVLAAIAHLETKFDASVTHLESAHGASIARLETKLDAPIVRLETIHDASIDSLEAKLEVSVARLAAGIDSARRDARADPTELRVAMMGRMDRLQDTMTEICDDFSVAMGSADVMQRANDNTRELVRLQGEQLTIMFRQIKRLEEKVRNITDDPWIDDRDVAPRTSGGSAMWPPA